MKNMISMSHHSMVIGSCTLATSTVGMDKMTELLGASLDLLHTIMPCLSGVQVSHCSIPAGCWWWIYSQMLTCGHRQAAAQGRCAATGAFRVDSVRRMTFNTGLIKALIN